MQSSSHAAHDTTLAWITAEAARLIENTNSCPGETINWLSSTISLLETGGSHSWFGYGPSGVQRLFHHCPGHSPVSVRHHMENFILLTVCADDFNLLIHEAFIINKLWYLLFIVLSILSLLATIETILILFSNLVTRTSQALMHSSDQEIKHNC